MTSRDLTARANERYERLGKICDGRFSTLFRCRSRDTGNVVAVKRYNETEDEEEDGDDRRRAKRMMMREIRLLKNLKHANLVNLIEVFKRLRKLHLVFEYCELTLADELQKSPEGIPIPQTARIIHQTLEALNFCHQHNCFHRDVKPRNILLTASVENSGTVKLASFGSARIFNPEEDFTDYVGTRWYRAPELLVGDVRYGPKIDVWSVGCVFVEMVQGETLWPGKSDLDQLYLIRRNVGELIPKHMQVFKGNGFYHKLSIPDSGVVKPLDAILKEKEKEVRQEGVDFMKRCLDKDPDKRWTCKELLEHLFFKSHDFIPAKVEEESSAWVAVTAELTAQRRQSQQSQVQSQQLNEQEEEEGQEETQEEEEGQEKVDDRRLSTSDSPLKSQPRRPPPPPSTVSSVRKPQDKSGIASAFASMAEAFSSTAGRLSRSSKNQPGPVFASSTPTAKKTCCGNRCS